MFSLSSIFLASLCSMLLNILGLIYRYVYRSKSSIAEENDSNFSENRSQLYDEVVMHNSNDGKEFLDLQNCKDESSVLLKSGLISKNSKCQILSGNTNVSGFLEEPKTMRFVVQELFVGLDKEVVSNDQIIGSEILGLEQILEEKNKEFDQESNFSSPFYFKLLNPSPSTNEETQENSSEMENIVSSLGVHGEEKPNFLVEGETKMNNPVGDDQVFSYEIELIPNSHSSIPVADQESDVDRDDDTFIVPPKIKKNYCENWMSSFLDEVDQAKSSSYDDHENEANFDDDNSEMLYTFKSSCEGVVDLDDDFIELEPQLVKLSDDLYLDRECDTSSSTCAYANSSQQECWDSDSDDENEDEDEVDVLSQHQNLVQQMKMELKNYRIRGLPTISEESETPKIIEDLRPLEIDHKIGYKDVMEGIQRFYKSYVEKMRKLDILNYQTSQAISFLQLKDSEAFTTGKRRANYNLPKFLAGKVKRVYADPMHKTISELHRDLEVVYVGQICMSWEILWWLEARGRELLEHDAEGRHSYNRAAEEFQQFQVLLQRFMEDEKFEGRRNDNFVRSRCTIRSLLQVPTIKDDCVKMNKELEKEERDVITLEMLVRIISETMMIFQEFVFGDKKVTNCGGLITKVDIQQHGLLLDVVSSLEKKGRRIKEQVRSQNCIVRKMRKHQERGLEREMLVAQVDLRLVSRVLNMSRLSGDQLVWCQKKLNSVNFQGRKLQRDECFLLFPC